MIAVIVEGLAGIVVVSLTGCVFSVGGREREDVIELWPGAARSFP